jgi:hypothetical protein
MHIIFGDEVAKQMADKYTILELDRFQVHANGPVFNSYCVVDKDSIPLEELSTVENMTRLHNKLMENYRKKNWEFCEQALEHLFGRWGKEVDSFYINITSRVRKYKDNEPDDFNEGIIKKYVDNQ